MPAADRPVPKHQGFMLLEALIGILIFAVGVLAVVGLQAMSIKDVADAKYRTDAALLANELISDAWVGSKDLATMQGAYASPSGSYYTTWAGDVASQLPGVTAASNAPTVAVAQADPASPTAIQMTVTVHWQLPGQQSAHSYSTVTELNCTVTNGSACSW
ncbi:hypothetical protein GALL_218270 [mine drainage metagenome]|uniref:Type IV pilus modification protein PilV n=1 Tax=mine drainage metagenome TaxID=410659 RepID=A0A1J5RJF6_9ZZZZ